MAPYAPRGNFDVALDLQLVEPPDVWIVVTSSGQSSRLLAAAYQAAKATASRLKLSESCGCLLNLTHSIG